MDFVYSDAFFGKNKVIIHSTVELLFIIIGIQTLLSIPYWMSSIFDNANFLARLIFSLAMTAVSIFFGYYLIKYFVLFKKSILFKSLSFLVTYISIALIIGILLRLSIIILVKVIPTSDAEVYMDLGKILSNNQPYYYTHRWAYWPIGYPFILSIWFRFFGSSVAGIQIFNLILYLMTSAGIYKLSSILRNKKAGNLAILLFAVWPDLIVQTAYPSKELVVIAFLPWMMAFYINNTGSFAQILKSRIIAGICAGLLILVQPSFILLVPSLLAISYIFGLKKSTDILIDILFFCFTASLVVLPWTIRNYHVMHSFVPVSTNGGEVLYRANNPLATGGYISEGEVNLWDLEEVDAYHKGMKLSKEWIFNNPKDFFRLAFQKQLLFLHDDSTGVYEVFKRGKAGPKLPDHIYFIIKMACILYWYFLWSIFCLSLIYLLRKGSNGHLITLFSASPFLYLYGIHSIFESGSRYHQPVSAILVFAISATILSFKHSISINFLPQTAVDPKN